MKPTSRRKDRIPARANAAILLRMEIAAWTDSIIRWTFDDYSVDSTLDLSARYRGFSTGNVTSSRGWVWSEEWGKREHPNIFDAASVKEPLLAMTC
jgi:hypothetical protein